MATQFPNSNDTFGVPSNPGGTALSSDGDSTRDHTTHHRDLGDAVVALEQNVPLLGHDHSGTGGRATSQLQQSNTHLNPDTDSSVNALHHTIGGGGNQAASGSHNHSGGAQGVNLAISSITGLAAALNVSFDYGYLAQSGTTENSLNSSTASAVSWGNLRLDRVVTTSTASTVTNNPPYYQLVLNEAAPYLIFYSVSMGSTTSNELGVRLIASVSGAVVGAQGRDYGNGASGSLNAQGWAFLGNTGPTAYTVQAYQVSSPAAAQYVTTTCFALKLKLN